MGTGWKCCKPRVLTFDEFLTIPPCTTGKHSTVDEPPATAPEPARLDDEPRLKPIATLTTPSTISDKSARSALVPAATPPACQSPTPNPALEEDSDDPDTAVPSNTICKRRSCGKSSVDTPRDSPCTYHSGLPVFHEGSKGWSCCKRRVLEFDEFMRIQGCKTRQGHCFIGKRWQQKQQQSSKDELEELEEVRNDFYQGPNTLNVSYYLKKIDKDKSQVDFLEDSIDMNLITHDGKRFRRKVECFQQLIPGECTVKILGTKLEMVLRKKEGNVGWPRLLKEGVETGARIQVGKALRA